MASSETKICLMGLDVQSQCYAEGKPHCSECKPYLHDDLVQD